MNAQGNSALHMLARETGRKYEDLYAEYHGTMKFWGDDELTAKQTARIQRIRAERAEEEECICESEKNPNPLCPDHQCCWACSTQSVPIGLNEHSRLWLCDGCNDKGDWCRGCRNLIDENTGFCSVGCENWIAENDRDDEIEVPAVCYECGVEGKMLCIAGEEDWRCLDCSCI
jgi:hypothetical protein